MYTNIKIEQSKFDKFILPLLALSVFPQSIISTGINISISDIYLVISILFMILIKRDRIIIFKKYYYLIGIYFFVCMFSFIIADEVKNTFIRFIQYLQYLVFTVIVFSNIRNVKSLKNILYMYTIIATGVGIISIIITQLNGYSGPIYVLGYQKNALGAVVGYAIPIIVGLIHLNKYKKRLIIALIINIITLLLTSSRGAMMGSIFATIIILANKGNIVKKIIAITSLIFIIIVILISLPDNFIDRVFDFDTSSSAYSRVVIYEDAIDKIRENPILGQGIGNYFIRLGYMNFSQDDPNNVFLLSLVETGVIGLIAFISILIYIYYFSIKNAKMFKNYKDLYMLNLIFISSFTARLIHVQVDVMWVRGTSLFMFAMVGMMLALRNIYSTKYIK